MLQKDTILNCDVMDGFREIDEGSIDLIVTSPPYNVGIDYDCWDDKMQPVDYFNWVEEWIKECHRVLKSDGRIAINIPYEVNMKSSGGGRVLMLARYSNIMERVGLKFAGMVDLVEDSPQRSKNTAWGSWLSPSAPYIYNPKECVLIYYKDVWKKERKGVSYFTDSDESKKEFMDIVFAQWTYKAETRGLTKANFSSDIPDRAIKILSWENDLVLDPFMGSGTTAISAKRLKRSFLGFDISKLYFNIAKERLDGCKVEDSR